jgi:hypothetical protein
LRWRSVAAAEPLLPRMASRFGLPDWWKVQPMKPEKRVTDAVEKAQGILADYVEPGARNCENTINQLMDVLEIPSSSKP